MADIQELPCTPYHVDVLCHESLVELVSTTATNGKVGAWVRTTWKEHSGTMAFAEALLEVVSAKYNSKGE